MTLKYGSSPRSGQDIPGRKTRRLQALRQPNPHPARNCRQVRARPLLEKVATVRYRRSDCGSAFTAPGGNRPRRTDPADARTGGARVDARLVAARRRLRSLHIAHERLARRSEAGRSARRKQAGRTRGHVTAIGADETVVRRVKGEKTVVGVITDAATGEVLGLDVLTERDSDGFMEDQRFRSRLRGRGDGRERPEYMQAGGRASGRRSSDLHSPREEVGAKPSRQDRRMGLVQGEDMAAADGAALQRRLGDPAGGARGSGRRRDSPPPSALI